MSLACLCADDHWSYREMSKARLGDARCAWNLIEVCHNLLSHAGKSWSAALGPRLRQAAYNIVDNSKTTVEGLLAGHVEQTALRSEGLPLVLVAQDTTLLDYSGHASKSDLGSLHHENTRGLLAHSVLAMQPDGEPLGVLGVSFRTRQPGAEKVHRNKRATADKESQKWLDGLRMTEQAFGSDQPILLIQDREADVFSFLAAPRRSTTHLLIRASRPRQVEVGGSEGKRLLFDAISSAPVLGTWTITVPRQAGKTERKAELSLQVQEMTALPPANQVTGEPNEPQHIWVIQATEVSPPSGTEAIHWTLISTMPVEDLTTGIQMVEYYTRRWIIERLHYTLKSGLNVERLQLDSRHRLENALALLYIVAWRVMSLTYAARSRPDAASAELLTETEVTVLRYKSGKDVSSLKSAVVEIAKMGGYEPYRNGPPPGLKVIWTGLRQLEAMTDMFMLARLQMTQA